jgi:hypothetical protein
MWQLGQMGGRVVGLTGFPNSLRLHGRRRECAVSDDLLAQVPADRGGVVLLAGLHEPCTAILEGLDSLPEPLTATRTYDLEALAVGLTGRPR